ncbi:MAG: hypothetical protein U0929_16310 [Planctomycetaceae bacterium]
MEARLPDAFCESVVSLLPTQEPSGRRGGRLCHPARGRTESDLVRVDGRLSLEGHPAGIRLLR